MVVQTRRKKKTNISLKKAIKHITVKKLKSEARKYKKKQKKNLVKIGQRKLPLYKKLVSVGIKFKLK